MAAAPVPPVSTNPIPDATPAPMSQSARIINTFIAPSKAFADLRRSAAWWAPFILLCIVSTIFAYAVGEKIGFDRAGDNVLQTRPKQYERIQKLPPADRQNTMQAVTKQTMIGTYAFPIIDLIIVLIISTLLFGTLKFAANADIPFKVMFAIVLYGGLPGVLKFLLATVTLFAGISPDGFNVQNPLAANLSVLFSPSESPVLYTVGAMVDVFAIWSLVLTAIGVASVSKVKRGTAFAVVFGWYIFFALVFAGLASLTA